MIDINELRQALGLVQLEEVSDLLDHFEAAEKDVARHKALAESALRVAKGWEDKCNELRAKIEAMEKQEPVAWQRLYKDGSGSEDFTDLPYVFEHQRPLYALPGAKGEQ